MKVILISLGFLLVFGCSSKDVGSNEENKIIRIKCTIGDDTLNTFNNTFTRVYYGEDIYTIDFWFTLAEQQRIISAIQNVNFFDLPDVLRYDDRPRPFISGSRGDQYCEILLNGKNKKVFWIDYLSFYDSDEYIRLDSIIVWNREEVKKLPMEVWY